MLRPDWTGQKGRGMAYAKLHLGAVDDPTLIALAEDHGPIAWALFFRFVVSGKAKLDSGADGWELFSYRHLATWAGVEASAEAVRECVAEMAEVGLLDVDATHERRVRVRPANVHLYQTPKDPTAAERMRRYRESKRNEHRNATVTNTVTGTVTGTVTDRNAFARARNKNGNVKDSTLTTFARSLVDGEPSTDPWDTDHTQTEQHRRGVDRRRVFTYWLKRTGRSETNGYRLTKERAAKIDARLNDGYSVEDLCRVIDYYATSPWHQGENPEGKRYDDLVTMLRNETQAQKALEAPADSLRSTASDTMREVLGDV